MSSVWHQFEQRPFKVYPQKWHKTGFADDAEKRLILSDGNKVVICQYNDYFHLDKQRRFVLLLHVDTSTQFIKYHKDLEPYMGLAITVNRAEQIINAEIERLRGLVNVQHLFKEAERIRRNAV